MTSVQTNMKIHYEICDSHLVLFHTSISGEKHDEKKKRYNYTYT